MNEERRRLHCEKVTFSFFAFCPSRTNKRTNRWCDTDEAYRNTVVSRSFDYNFLTAVKLRCDLSMANAVQWFLQLLDLFNQLCHFPNISESSMSIIVLSSWWREPKRLAHWNKFESNQSKFMRFELLYQLTQVVYTHNFHVSGISEWEKVRDSGQWLELLI